MRVKTHFSFVQMGWNETSGHRANSAVSVRHSVHHSKVSEHCTDSVLQKTLVIHTVLYISFAQNNNIELFAGYS